MEQTAHEFKYQKHSEKQYLAILTTAECLFVEKGIDKVTLADIAGECGIMRSTFYRYFRSKEVILWHIMRRHTERFAAKLCERFEATEGTAFARYKSFLAILYETFVCDKNAFLFINLFNDTYQYATCGNEAGIYKELYPENSFGSGDTVRFLMEKFDDGSLKQGLDAKTTAVSITYGALSIVAGMSKQVKTLNLKYGISPEDLVRRSFDLLLEGIIAEKS